MTVSRMVVYRVEQCLKASIPKGSSLIKKSSSYEPRSHQKGLRRRPMLENDNTGTKEEKSNLHCIQDGKKDGRKKSETFQKTPVACSDGSEASGEKHTFVE